MIIFGILFMLFGIGMLVVIARQPVRPSPRQKRAAGAGFMAHDAAAGGDGSAALLVWHAVFCS
ncbi:hypothetical protein [Prosthecobacter dejongeii]|uniref:Uncharacterized protein n=1 Tax=Prosthecobacter dejongeii TaxID=48465 RepID=A0A7W7YMV0_9BACT|nr:hypothetical protein [Prosthecobacter dejongeii]MBB5038865.1 hypothetical protein [Prosthecobacter dejongeii]